MFLISLVTSAFSATTVIRDDRGNSLPIMTNVAVVISCSTPIDSESGALVDALKLRSDVNYVVELINPTAKEIDTAFADLVGEEPNRLLIVSFECGTTVGGDTDEEAFYSGGETQKFVSVLKAAKPVATSSLWLIDASRKPLSPSEFTGFGPTADDVVKVGILPDALAISTGVSGKYADGGLIKAATYVISYRQGELLALDAFYRDGIKSITADLELSTSMGVTPNDQWDKNWSRMVLPGGPLINPIAPIATMPSIATLPKAPVKPKPSLPAGLYLAGSGVLFVSGGAVFGANAINEYQTLVEYNMTGAESQDQLTQAAVDYNRDKIFAIGLGSIGALATIGGLTWAVLDRDGHSVTIVPTGNGVKMHGSW